MHRKSSKSRGAAAQGRVGLTAALGPPLKAGPPNPSPAAAVAEAEGLKVPGDGASAAAEALELLHIDPASDGDPPPPPPSEPEPEPPAPSQPPPVEASSSGRSAAGGSLDEEAVRKLHELAEAGGEEVPLTEEEVHANDQRQEDEVMRCSLPLRSLVAGLDQLKQQYLAGFSRCHGRITEIQEFGLRLADNCVHQLKKQYSARFCHCHGRMTETQDFGLIIVAI